MSINDWKEYKLDDVCLKITDGSHTSPPSVENGYYMASVKDMDEYGFNFKNCRMISDIDYMKLIKNGCQPQYGDILIGKDGARYLEDAFVFKQDTNVVLLSSIAILRPDKTKIISEFLYYFLTNKNTRIDIKNNYGSGSAIPRMVLKDFKRVPIPVPTIPEQRAIVNTLSCLDDKIELNNRINNTLEEMAQAIFKSWFVDFEPFQDKEFKDSELGKIPKEWRVGILEEVCDIKYGKNLPTSKLKKEGYYVFGGNGVIGYHDDYLYEKPQVLVSCRGAASGKVLTSYPYSFITNNSLVLDVNENLNFEFLKYYCLNNTFEKYATGSAQPQITIENIKFVRILIPPKKIIDEFKDIVSIIEKISYDNFAKNKTFTDIRDSLLPKLMSRKIQVPTEEIQ